MNEQLMVPPEMTPEIRALAEEADTSWQEAIICLISMGLRVVRLARRSGVDAPVTDLATWTFGLGPEEE